MVGAHPTATLSSPHREILQVTIVIIGLLIAHWRLRETSIEAAVARQPRWVIHPCWAVMAGSIILTQGNGNSFIYFQF